MAKLSVLLLALLGLAACATYDEVPPQYQEPARQSTATWAPRAVAPALAPGAAAYRPGYGVVESIALATPVAPSAAAGGSAPSPLDRATYHLNVRMEDGSVQTVVRDNRSILVGDRVQVTSDGRVHRP